MNLENSMKLLPEIWKNKKSILEGIKNKAFKKSDIEDIALFRHSICKGCVWNSKKYETYEEVPEFIREIKDEDWITSCIQSNNEKCLYCSCTISIDNSIKLRSLSSKCPLPEPKWEAVVEDEEQIAKIYTMAAKNEEQ